MAGWCQYRTKLRFIKATISFLLPAVFGLLLVACSGGVSESDIEAIVEARVEAVLTAVPAQSPLALQHPPDGLE
jgi:hypothetical protein